MISKKKIIIIAILISFITISVVIAYPYLINPEEEHIPKANLLITDRDADLSINNDHQYQYFFQGNITNSGDAPGTCIVQFIVHFEIPDGMVNGAMVYEHLYYYDNQTMTIQPDQVGSLRSVIIVPTDLIAISSGPFGGRSWMIKILPVDESI